MSAPFVLPVAAFLGALATTSLLYRIATWRGRTSIATMLLAGLALGAFAGAGTGFRVFLADDRQLRDITFWLLGSLAGATWPKVAVIAPFLLVLLVSIGGVGRGLDLLVLGETEAFHMGIAVERLKRFLIVLIAAAAGAAVSVSGVIGFVGIVVPHLLRLVIGPGHRLSIAGFGVLRRHPVAHRRHLRADAALRRLNCRLESSLQRSVRRSFSFCCSSSAALLVS